MARAIGSAIDEERAQVHVDLTGSKLGPPWRSVELTMATEGRSDKNLRDIIACYYEIPIAQVGEVQRAYPCAVCGWARRCGDPPGEDCHS